MQAGKDILTRTVSDSTGMHVTTQNEVTWKFFRSIHDVHSLYMGTIGCKSITWSERIVNAEAHSLVYPFVFPGLYCARLFAKNLPPRANRERHLYG